jgi:hypothetical protein
MLSDLEVDGLQVNIDSNILKKKQESGKVIIQYFSWLPEKS